jgi:ecotin
MKIFPLLVLFLWFSVTCLGQETASKRNLDEYPPAEKGQVRYVWHPPQLEQENDAKIELIVGKNVDTDGMNHYHFRGQIDTVPKSRSGYDGYVAKSEGLIRTLMGIPPGTPRVNKFIGLGQSPTLIRYNSRLPVVVYVPKDL